MDQLLYLGPEAIQTGIWKVGKAAGLLWEEGNNVVFRDRGFRRVAGAAQQGPALGDQVRDLAQAYVAGTRRVYAGTDTDIELYSLTGGVWAKSTLGTWPTAGTYADLETWGTWVVATNGVDPVKVWKNGGGLINLAGVPFSRAKVIKRKQPFLLAFNTNNIGDTAAEWSSDSDIEAWTASGANKAGNYNLRDLESEILAVEDLGPRLAVYSRSSMTVGTFVGGGSVWGWQRAISGIGAVSRRSVVTLDPFNYGLTREGIFKTDGNSFVYVDDPAMNKYIKDTADFSREALFWGVRDTTLKCVTFYFQDASAAWHSVSYFPEMNFFTKGNLQLTAAGPREVFDYPLVADEGLRLGYWQSGAQFFGQDFSYSLKTRPLDFGNRTNSKIVQLISVDGTWGAATGLRVRAHDDPEAAGTIVYDKALVRENFFEWDSPFFSLEFYGSADVYVTAVEIFGALGGLVK